LSNKSSDMNESPESGGKGKVGFFTGFIGGILVGAIFDNVGAGLAIGILLWLMTALIGNKGK